MSLLTGSSADEVLSGGFLNRFMVVIEEGTNRVFPHPRKGVGEEKLLKLLSWMKAFSGQMKMPENGEADKTYVQWYHRRKKKMQLDGALAEVTQRGTDHALRMAMLIHAAECNTLIICDSCMRAAISILEHIERNSPALVKAIHGSSQSSHTDFVLEQLIKLGGVADHSTLLRKCHNKLNAAQFRAVMTTLNESGLVRINTKGAAQFYMIINKEDDHSVGIGA